MSSANWYRPKRPIAVRGMQTDFWPDRKGTLSWGRDKERNRWLDINIPYAYFFIWRRLFITEENVTSGNVMPDFSSQLSSWKSSVFLGTQPMAHRVTQQLALTPPCREGWSGRSSHLVRASLARFCRGNCSGKKQSGCGCVWSLCEQCTIEK